MAIKFKQPSIKYTSRDFNSIRNDLIEYARRYYPDTYKDFNEASFGALMVDAVSYIGDMMSFYLDYQANESFLSTANEYNNVVKHAKALGFKLDSVPSSYGVVTLFARVPAAASGMGVNRSYLPVLKRGTTFSSTTGATFMLMNDVNFADPANQTVVAKVNQSTGLPSEYAIRAYGEVVSGVYEVKTFQVGKFEKFKRVDLGDPNLTEIVKVVDADGNEYFEVDYLSQNIIYRPITNTGANSDIVPNLLKPFVAMRRFVVERDFGRNFLQFGYGSDDENLLSNNSVLRPEDIVLDRHARDHITDLSFDPTRLLQSDKFGIAPSNTTITVSYRKNTSATVNAGVGAINSMNGPIVAFPDSVSLNESLKRTVINSLEVTNDEPIVGDVSYPSMDEVKRKIFDTFSSQNRAVTAQDYKAIVYMMPAKFGSIKRCNIFQDPDAFKRNLNIYVVSEDFNGNLTKTNDTIKNNLKNWINQYRMVNDTVDIVDANIVNIGIEFTIVTESEVDKFSILQAAETELKAQFLNINEIGEPINVANIYRILNQVEGISDTVDVTMVNKTSALHSAISFDIGENTSFDGRYLLAPEDVVFEIRYLDSDIKGTVR